MNELQRLMELGAQSRVSGKLVDAEAAFRAASELAPDVAEVHFALGTTLKDQMRVPEAIASYREALRLDPMHAGAFSNLIFAMHYLPQYTPQEIARLHREWGNRFADPLTPPSVQFPNRKDPNRKLRVGYVSADWHAHPVSFFMIPPFLHRDRSAFEVFCYGDTRRRDVISDFIKQAVDAFRDTIALTDEQLAQQIREDRIDILVDLAGHTGGNRLLVFARKPAPVQVTYLGYPDTTGLRAIDFRITDSIADPLGQTERLHTEKLIRIPGCVVCYSPPPGEFAPDLAAASRRPVVFGSFNRLAKVTPDMIATWCRILREVPQSRMLMKASSLSEKSIADRVASEFAKHGINHDRLDLMPSVPALLDHLRAYDRITIALDTFPYNGTTTTCEALWMGVPVITRAGHTHVSRVGASILTAAGMTDFIADSDEQYVERAVALAKDDARLTQLKRELRDRVTRSRLSQVNQFVGDFETALRSTWQQCCQS